MPGSAAMSASASRELRRRAARRSPARRDEGCAPASSSRARSRAAAPRPRSPPRGWRGRESARGSAGSTARPSTTCVCCSMISDEPDRVRIARALPRQVVAAVAALPAMTRRRTPSLCPRRTGRAAVSRRLPPGGAAPPCRPAAEPALELALRARPSRRRSRAPRRRPCSFRLSNGPVIFTGTVTPATSATRPCRPARSRWRRASPSPR